MFDTPVLFFITLKRLFEIRLKRFRSASIFFPVNKVFKYARPRFLDFLSFSFLRTIFLACSFDGSIELSISSLISLKINQLLPDLYGPVKLPRLSEYKVFSRLSSSSEPYFTVWTFRGMLSCTCIESNALPLSKLSYALKIVAESESTMM